MKTLVFLCFMASALAIPSQVKRIVNGGPAILFSSPHQVSIQYAEYVDEWYHTCSGVLIKDNKVLTAAECVYERDTERFRVQLGLLEFYGQPVDYIQTIEVSSFVVHYNYVGTYPGLADDIAIMTLEHLATLNANVMIANVAPVNSTFINNKCVITGWGLTSTSPVAQSPHLQTADITEISITECQSRWPREMITSKHVCGYQNSASSGKRPSACAGDTGGPMMCNDNGTDFLVGIISWGSGSCDGEKPTVCTRVNEYLVWIAQHN